MADTDLDREDLVRELAYALWEQAGRPDGSADEFWHEAVRRADETRSPQDDEVGNNAPERALKSGKT